MSNKAIVAVLRNTETGTWHPAWYMMYPSKNDNTYRLNSYYVNGIRDRKDAEDLAWATLADLNFSGIEVMSKIDEDITWDGKAKPQC